MDKSDQDCQRCTVFLNLITGKEHSIAVGGEGVEDEYQVMPDTLDEQDFFDWYCDTYPEKQFFKNVYECVLRYVTIRAWYLAGNRTELEIAQKIFGANGRR